jgi:hypothetical protein
LDIEAASWMKKGRNFGGEKCFKECSEARDLR